jgi:hypothetical protein
MKNKVKNEVDRPYILYFDPSFESIGNDNNMVPWVLLYLLSLKFYKVIFGKSYPVEPESYELVITKLKQILFPFYVLPLPKQNNPNESGAIVLKYAWDLVRNPPMERDFVKISERYKNTPIINNQSILNLRRNIWNLVQRNLSKKKF